MTTRQAIRIEIHKLKTLPPLPAQAQTILGLLNDPDIPFAQLSNALEQSPAITARLLGMANSAYFGHCGKVKTVRQAIVSVLGLNLVKSLTLGLIMGDRFEIAKCKSFSPNQYWYCAVLTATATHQFCTLERDKIADPTVGYTAGLLANLGLLAMVHTFPDAMDQIFRESIDSGQSVSEILWNCYSIDQYQVGSWLVRRWQLPEIYQCVIAKQKDPDYDGANGTLAKLVTACSSMSYQLFHYRECLTETLGMLSDLGFNQEVSNSEIERHRNKLNDLKGMVDILARG